MVKGGVCVVGPCMAGGVQHGKEVCMAGGHMYRGDGL